MAKRLLCTLALAASLPVFSGGCATTTTTGPKNAQPGVIDKVTASVKSGSAKLVAAVKPTTRTTPVVNPSPKGDAGPTVFVAAAKMREESGDLDDAEAHYKKALDLDRNHLGALVGYARLEDRRHNTEAAIRLYQRAMKKHSKDASLHNDFGLCYQRHSKLPEAAKELATAVELKPDSKLYRNNLATVYVDQGKTKEALAQLTIAHGEAVGHYNLGFLLEQKKDHGAAIAQFRIAVEKDPSLVAAQQWIAKLSSEPAPNVVSSTAAFMVVGPAEESGTGAHNATAIYTAEPAGSRTVIALPATGGDAPSTPSAPVASTAATRQSQTEYLKAPRLTNALRDNDAAGGASSDGVAPATTPAGR